MEVDSIAAGRSNKLNDNSKLSGHANRATSSVDPPDWLAAAFGNLIPLPTCQLMYVNG